MEVTVEEKVEEKIEAIEMQGSASSSIRGLGDYKEGKVRLVPEDVSVNDARTLVKRGDAHSVKRPKVDKKVDTPKDEALKTPGESYKKGVNNNGK